MAAFHVEVVEMRKIRKEVIINRGSKKITDKNKREGKYYEKI